MTLFLDKEQRSECFSTHMIILSTFRNMLHYICSLIIHINNRAVSFWVIQSIYDLLVHECVPADNYIIRNSEINNFFPIYDKVFPDFVHYYYNIHYQNYYRILALKCVSLSKILNLWFGQIPFRFVSLGNQEWQVSTLIIKIIMKKNFVVNGKEIIYLWKSGIQTFISLFWKRVCTQVMSYLMIKITSRWWLYNVWRCRKLFKK
jgi:hypothetical protein